MIKIKSKILMEWTKEKTLILIDEYKRRRGLWDMTHDDYRKKEIKRDLLDEVSQKFNRSVPPVEIEKKFHTLRTQYHREINRMNQNRGTEPYKSKWFAFKHLQFLSSPKACRGGKVLVKTKLEEQQQSPPSQVTIQLKQEPQPPQRSRTPEVTLNVIEDHTSSEKYTIFKQEHQITVQEDYGTNNNNNNNNNNKNTISIRTNSNSDDLHDKASCNSSNNEIIVSVPKTNLTDHRDSMLHVNSNNGRVIHENVGRKDLEQLFQNATKHLHEQMGTKIMVKEINIPINYNSQNDTKILGTETHYEEYDEEETHPDENTHNNSDTIIENTNPCTGNGNITISNGYQQTNHSPKYIKQISHKRSGSNGAGGTNGTAGTASSSVDPLYEEVIFEDDHQSPTTAPSPMKKMYFEKLPIRDENSIYGEYVANEMRFITSRDILTTLKHKINNALYEANMAELKKSD